MALGEPFVRTGAGVTPAILKHNPVPVIGNGNLQIQSAFRALIGAVEPIFRKGGYKDKSGV
jgi:hypothetical protein